MSNEKHKPTVEEIRAAIFSGNNKPRGVIVNFFGVDIEIRQMRVGDMHLLAASEESGDREAVLRVLINMSFKPETDERVFTQEDYPALKKLPYGPDMNRVAEALKELTDANLPKEKEL